MSDDRNIFTYTQDYLKHEFESVMVHYRKRKILEFFEIYKPKNILEIGCGLQSIFDFYHDYNKFVVIEPSVTFYKSVMSSEYFNSKITLINDFFENIAFKLNDIDFDLILCSSLLHEVDEPFKLLESIKKICKSRTILHINVPNAQSFHLLWAYKSGLISRLNVLTETASKLQQFTSFDLDRLCDYCASLDFVIIDKGSYFIKPFNHKKMSKCLEDTIIDDQLLDGLYTLTDYFPNNGAEIFVNCKLKNGN